VVCPVYGARVRKIGAKLQAGPLAEDECSQLYAAQQALVWALEPTGFKSPYDLIVRTNIPEDSEDCRVENDHSLFSDSPDRRAS
jgi:hypothetical protein